MLSHPIAWYSVVQDKDDGNDVGWVQMSNRRKEDNEPNAPSATRHGAEGYAIRVKGYLDGRRATWFDGLSLSQESDGTTTIYGPAVDQAALHGLLRKVRDLGLPLVSVSLVEPEPSARPAVNADKDE